MSDVTGKGTSGSVAIVTLQGRTNYGNRLQNYAVAKLYERFGYATTTLLREDHPSLTRRAVESIRNATSFNDSSKEPKENIQRLAAFERFDNALRFSKASEIDANLSGSFDYFSVGSDQVWNLGRLSDNDSWFYLRFARPEQRIALAPSIGVSQLNKKQMKRLAKGVSGFRNLSIREQQGADLIMACSGREATVICDPTLALHIDEWRRVEDRRLTPENPYVLTYLLGDSNPEATNVLSDLAKEGGLPVVSLSDRSELGEPPAGPAEFISLIDSAEHVVTDSFHAAVFASVLQTPLTIVHREGGTSMFSRLETLAQMIGIGHKIYDSPDFNLSRAGDYEGVKESIEHERKKFMNYIEMCLDA